MGVWSGLCFKMGGGAERLKKLSKTRTKNLTMELPNKNTAPSEKVIVRTCGAGRSGKGQVKNAKPKTKRERCRNWGARNSPSTEDDRLVKDSSCSAVAWVLGKPFARKRVRN